LDPVSQGVLGGAASLAISKNKQFRIAILCGIFSGMAPDLDALIRSDSDPLLYLEFHRQFTHSLIFIPFGALICTVLFHNTIARSLSFLQTYVFCLFGYATHGLLDACTSYGTQLFWPFSDVRVAWHTISIIDPLFTVPLVGLLAVGAFRSSALFGKLAMLWVFIYMSVGFVQKQRVEAFAQNLASSRGHVPERLTAKPSFANLLVWKSIYEADGKYYVDAIRAAGNFRLFPGQSVLKLDIMRDLPWLDLASQQAKDLERFRWFSNNFLALDQHKNDFVVDMRYSMLPNEVDGLWGIQLTPDLDVNQHVEFVWDRNVTAKKRATLKAMILDRFAD
jgi:inner membrane protein